VLLSNDDGFASRGLQALAEAMAPWADVITVAPETEQSATSHSLSLHRPLRARRVRDSVFAIDGTPADCVYVALHAGTKFLPRWPDLVVSGINRGLNLGQDAFYSGTVAAAREGALRGIPALAASAHTKADIARTAALGSRLARQLFADTRETHATRPPPKSMRATPLLNLNVPLDWNGKVQSAKLGSRLYDEELDIRTDPRGREYIWLGGSGVKHEPDPGSDTDAYDASFASLTMLLLDLTRSDDAFLNRLISSADAQR
jgi:5'-nucleotidase